MLKKHKHSNGRWNSIYKTFAKWQEQNIFEKIFTKLGVDADMQDLSIDSTSCKAHQHSAGTKKCSKCRNSSAYRDEQRLKDHENPYSSRCIMGQKHFDKT